MGAPQTPTAPSAADAPVVGASAAVAPAVVEPQAETVAAPAAA